MSNNTIGCLFALTNFIWTNMKIHFMPKNVKKAIVYAVKFLLHIQTLFFKVSSVRVYFGVNESIFTLIKQLLTQRNGKLV